MAPQLPVQLLMMLIILFQTVLVLAAYPRTGIFGAMRRSIMKVSHAEFAPEFETHYYRQTLDHFNYKPESYATFQQRYILNFKHWGGANTSSPIFVYAGEEGPITYDVSYVGFIIDLAARFKGLLLYIEHRYYGESFPFGSKGKTFQNASTLGYLSSEQALADYAQLIVDVKKNLSAENCPVVIVGGSYGGMLASWFRLKYPHIVIGALASSAPVRYFIGITPEDAYHVVATKDFQDTSEKCYNTIRQSWSEIDRVAAETDGLGILGNIFTACNPINSSQELKDYLEMSYMASAQFDNPPDYYVSAVCNAIDGAPEGIDILSRIAAGLNASIYGGGSCNYVFQLKKQRQSAWSWQTCTEIVIPMGTGDNDTMFQASPFDLKKYTDECIEVFGIVPRPHWIPIQFGGYDIKSVLKNFGSNIIFSNGLRDPYSAGGVLEDISDTVVAVHTNEGAHFLDILTPTANDPDWLVAQRHKEIKIIAYWIAEYHAKLASKTNT